MEAISRDECSVCGSDQIITTYDTGEIICEGCGAVISDKRDGKGPEWRSYTTAGIGREVNDRNRAGIPFTLARSDMGLSTIIGKTNKDARGNKINSSMLSTIKRLRTWDSRT